MIYVKKKETDDDPLYVFVPRIRAVSSNAWPGPIWSLPGWFNTSLTGVVWSSCDFFFWSSPPQVAFVHPADNLLKKLIWSLPIFFLAGYGVEGNGEKARWHRISLGNSPPAKSKKRYRHPWRHVFWSSSTAPGDLFHLLQYATYSKDRAPELRWTSMVTLRLRPLIRGRFKLNWTSIW